MSNIPNNFTGEDNYTDKDIKSGFRYNRLDYLLVSQGQNPNCALIAFFIALSESDEKIQKIFIEKTIKPGVQNGKKGYFVREFVPRKMSDDFLFIPLRKLARSHPPREQLLEVLWHDQKEDIIYESDNMYGSLGMRLIEYARNQSKKKKIHPMWIISYLESCGIKGDQISLTGDEIIESNYDIISNIPKSGIGLIGFNGVKSNKGITLRSNHAYAILGFDRKSKEITIANPRFYDSSDKKTTIQINLDSKELISLISMFILK